MSDENVLLYVKLSELAQSPYKATKNSVGFDLYSPTSYKLLPKSIVTIPLDLAFKFPPSTYGRLAVRSSLAKCGLEILGGVIDPDFRGNVSVILRNCGQDDIIITKGQRFVQLVCEKAEFPKMKQVTHLDTTGRNEKGFGSSGKF